MIRNKRYPHGGFTLIELLVVVLIIGILAAIALPQYKMAVGKTRYATLKNFTRSVAESAQRYYMLHDSYPKNTSDFDIDLDVTHESFSSSLYFDATNGIACYVWQDGQTACYKEILSKVMYLYINSKGKLEKCLVFNMNESDVVNRVCQNETGHNARMCGDNGYCVYDY